MQETGHYILFDFHQCLGQKVSSPEPFPPILLTCFTVPRLPAEASQGGASKDSQGEARKDSQGEASQDSQGGARKDSQGGARKESH